jgi:NADH-quinone oxidoreductase subunit C
MDLHELTVTKIQAVFPDAVESVKDFRGERTIRIRRERIVEVCRLLRDDPGLRYNYLSDLSATDYYPDEPRFCVNYHLLSMPHNNARVRLAVYVNGEDAVVPSVTGVWPAANWLEREAYDMFGVTFTGHPDLRRILMPQEWSGYPQRRDYPLGYEDVQFTHNVDEIQATKPRPKTV